MTWLLKTENGIYNLESSSYRIELGGIYMFI